ncbi:MAG: 6-pyruvoyl trahydropterin synthase family protein [Actinomycetota bacterium]
MFEVGLSTSFNAWHVMPGVEGPEGELHQHDYRLEVVASRPRLDERGMVCDLDDLERALRDTVSIVEGKDLEMIRPPDEEAVTVEVLARWSHEEVGRRLGEGEVENLSVRIWESPIAFGGYSGPPPKSDA